eukprot:588784-Amphidinium_carterae.1
MLLGWEYKKLNCFGRKGVLSRLSPHESCSPSPSDALEVVMSKGTPDGIKDQIGQHFPGFHFHCSRCTPCTSAPSLLEA